jgi:hypothetical protein
MGDRTDQAAVPELPDDAFMQKLKRLYEQAMARQQSKHPLEQPGDPSTAEFTAALCKGLTDEHRRLWGDSPYCARLLKLHWRSEPPSPAVLVLWEAGALTGFEAAAMKEHLTEPEGRRSRLIAACIRDRVLTQQRHPSTRGLAGLAIRGLAGLAIRAGEDTEEPSTDSAVELARAREAFQRLMEKVRPVVNLWWFLLTRNGLVETRQLVESLEARMQTLPARTEELSVQADDLRARLEAVERMRRAYGISAEDVQEAQRLREQLATVEGELRTARDNCTATQGRLERGRGVLADSEKRCAALFAELPESFRHRISLDPVSDWLTTTYPTLQEVIALLAAAYPALEHVQGWQAQTSPEAVVAHALLGTGDPIFQDAQEIFPDASPEALLDRIQIEVPERKEASEKRDEDYRDTLRFWSLAEKFIRQLEEPAT